MQSVDWKVIGFVWAYVVLWSFVQDAAKVLNYKLLHYLHLVEDLGVIDENYGESSEPELNMGVPIAASDPLGSMIRERADTLERDRRYSKILLQSELETRSRTHSSISSHHEGEAGTQSKSYSNMGGRMEHEDQLLRDGVNDQLSKFQNI